MGTIFDAYEKVLELQRKFPETIKETLKDSDDMIRAMVREQLMAGMDENGRPLKPSYIDDPYFAKITKSKKAAISKAQGYMKYKEKLYPPGTTFMLGLKPRSVATPNLIITGPYHRSITPRITNDSIIIESVGFYAGKEIEEKYGSKHLGLTKQARRHLINSRIKPAIVKLLTELGFK